MVWRRRAVAGARARSAVSPAHHRSLVRISEHPPYAGACDDVIPHLTVAERRLADLPAGAARGRGYVRLLAQRRRKLCCPAGGAGVAAEHLDLSPEFQIDTLCDMLPVSWQVSAPTYPNAEPALDKARSLAKLVARLWEDLGHPSSERITEYAI